RGKGLSPGTVVYIGKEKTSEVRITVIDYNKEDFQKKEIIKPEDCYPFKDKDSITWINIDGVHNTEVIEKIGGFFDFHPLLLEDIGDTTQRPKTEDFDNYIFVVLKMLYFNEKNEEVEVEQVSLILGGNFVISFQEKEGDVFDPVRERIEKDKGRIRKMGSDYLLYSLIDAVVDNYFSVLEKIGDRIEELEEDIVKGVAQESLENIHKSKKYMILLRRSVWPLREVINSLSREKTALISENVLIYFRDVYDHTIQVIETIETFRDMLSGLHDTYLSSISNKMNEIMKVLTMFASIFIPLTFLAGIYGMNFSYMPELDWRWGYFTVWGIIIIVGISMILYFKRKKWL
ncbi:MAG: magnesium/cobalt transporter CorA, partial [candidate division WOR-3 bacterium]